MNGTWVNGHRIRKGGGQYLHDGDEIEIGSVILKFFDEVALTDSGDLDSVLNSHPVLAASLSPNESVSLKQLNEGSKEPLSSISTVVSTPMATGRKPERGRILRDNKAFVNNRRTIASRPESSAKSPNSRQ